MPAESQLQPGQRVRWPAPRHARALGWEGAYGPGPFEVVRATDLSDRGIPAAAVLKLREINPVWLAQLGDDTRGR